MIATSGFLAAVECTKFVFCTGPTGGAYSDPPDPLAGIRGATSKEMEREGKEGKRRRGEEREREEGGG